jgi:hypothetical protein
MKKQTFYQNFKLKKNINNLRSFIRICCDRRGHRRLRFTIDVCGETFQLKAKEKSSVEDGNGSSKNENDGEVKSWVVL